MISMWSIGMLTAMQSKVGDDGGCPGDKKGDSMVIEIRDLNRGDGLIRA